MQRVANFETITGAEIRVGDVIKSAAMRSPRLVVRVWESSTGNTAEVLTVERGLPPDSPLAGRSQQFYRIGKTSKVKRYSNAEAKP